MNSSSLGSIPARAAALLLDSAFLLLPQLLFGHVFGTLFINRFGYTDPTMIAIGYNLWAGLVSILIAWIYFAGLESSPLQATLGKRALGLVVVTTSGERLSFQRASGRFVSRILSGIIIGIGYIIALFNENRQALHDLLARTLVLSKKQQTFTSADHDTGIAAFNSDDTANKTLIAITTLTRVIASASAAMIITILLAAYLIVYVLPVELSKWRTSSLLTILAPDGKYRYVPQGVYLDALNQGGENRGLTPDYDAINSRNRHVKADKHPR